MMRQLRNGENDSLPNNALEPTPTAIEFMNDLSYTTIIEFAEPLAGRRGSVLFVRRLYYHAS